MELKLSLWENSKTFLEEAISKAVLAETSPVAWKFAILTLVQAIELAMKARLEREHAILVYANVDKPRNTVSFDVGVARLREIAKLNFSEAELQDLRRAKAWRDAVVHAAVDVRVEHLKPVFARLLGFHSDFCRRHIGQEIHSFLPDAQFSAALAIEEYSRELMAAVERRLVEEKIKSKWVWPCRSCGFDAFVVADDINTCYLCGQQDEVVACDCCGEPAYFDETEAVYNPREDTDGCICRRCYIRCEDEARWNDN
jgi:hypothetical protein